MAKKKKRANPEVEELLARPWCYYCERDFDDLKILIAHQKAKHYKCEKCGRRLNTAGGLRVHMEQVHKEQLEAVDNAIPGRESIDLEIFGTEGIPESEVAAHNQRILSAFAQREADRRAGSGQPGAGSKRPKIDISKDLDPDEIKKKLEAHKKAMAAAAQGTSGNGAVTGPQSPGRSASPGQGAYEAQGSPPQGAYPQVQATSPPPFQQGVYPIPQAPGPYPAPTYPPQNQGPFPPAAYGQPPFPQQPMQFGRGGGPPASFNGFQPQHPQHPSFTHNPGGFNPPQHNQFQQGPPPHVQHPQHPQRHQVPPAPPSLPQAHQIPGLPPRPNAPGLPPRPNFNNPGMGGMNNGGFGRGGPSGSGGGGWNQPPAHQQQQGGFGGPGAYVPPPQGPSQQFGQPQQPQPFSPHQPHSQQQFGGFGATIQHHQHQPHAQNNGSAMGHQGRNDSSASLTATGVEGVKMESSDTSTPNVTVPPTEKKKDEKPKRETKMVYSDNEISPEEKRALLPRYEYHPPKSSVEVATTA
ncbi:hypothetical protein DFP73DRAFT_154124 [Morchella snyderi]|nr:hypothetical protein DFP73DRAFT_154124 [Morchella snyderi]